jgi:nickel-dependent lactate racemase
LTADNPQQSLTTFSIPYGRDCLTAHLPDDLRVDRIAPHAAPAIPDPLLAVSQALDAPLGGGKLADFTGVKSVAIAINDKTRPVPHTYLLPPLLQRVEALGVPPAAITLIIATGTHVPMRVDESPAVLPVEIIQHYPVISHDCDDQANLKYLGETARGTPVSVNRHFAQADLRLVVGNIEPHQLEGFSGGVKSAAIGLAGRETINRNHALMMDPNARLGEYGANPARQDVEAIGRRMGVNLALNAILNEQKEIVRVLAGDPVVVMQVGLPLVREICQVQVDGPYDMMIASPGGHPKDINLCQAQKGVGRASLILRAGGEMILVAACPEGIGSRACELWMEGVTSYAEVFEKFRREGFRIGPHKAYQIARDASRAHVQLMSQMPPETVRRLLLDPAVTLDEALAVALARLPAGGRVGVMTLANATIPVLDPERGRG